MQRVLFEKVAYQPLNTIAYERIKEKIINNELLPGEKLDVTTLCESLGVSRTPVLNALKELAQKGYVLISPRSGTHVREHTREEVSAFFDFREVLEQLTVRKFINDIDTSEVMAIRTRLAALLKLGVPSRDVLDEYLNAEMDLHQYVLRLCPPIVSVTIENLVDLTKRLRKLHLRYLTEVRGEVGIAQTEIQIHLDIADALLAGNTDRAEAYLVRDIRVTRDEILRDFEAIEAFAREQLANI